MRTLVSYDGLLRQGECDKLRNEDVPDNDHQCALLLGVAARGERTKTGVRQGVVLRTDFAVQALRHHIGGLQPRDHVFRSTTASSFRRDWKALTTALGLPPRPPHALRHAGAAELVRSGATMGDVKLRGRWRSDACVRRYCKTHDLIAYDAALDPDLRLSARAFLADPIGILRLAAPNVFTKN